MVTDELLSLHDRPREVPPFTGRLPAFDAAAAAEAARALHQHRLAHGWRPVGRKIGFTNRTIWPRYGVYEPIWGHVYDRTMRDAPDGRAEVALAGLVQPRIEPEVCFGLATAPQPGRPLAGAIAWVAHAVEIVQCYHPGWKLGLADSIAANGLHGRLVVGTRIPVRELPADWAAALPRLGMKLERAGRLVDEGIGANVLDGPLEALAWLVGATARVAPLADAEIVTTGTLTDAHPVAAGETWRTVPSGLPLAPLEITFR